MKKNELVIVGCAEGHGKTTTLINSINMMLSEHNRVMFLSYECKKNYIIDRFNNLDDLLIYDEPLTDIDDIRKYIEEFKPNCLFIDHLQLIPNYNEAIHKLKDMVSEYNLRIFINLILKEEEFKLSGETLKTTNEICKFADRVWVFKDYLKSQKVNSN